MRTALTVLADLLAITCLFLSHLPSWLKLGGGICLGAIPFAAFFFYLGERRRWVHDLRQISEFEREVRQLEEQLAETVFRPPRSARRAA